MGVPSGARARGERDHRHPHARRRFAGEHLVLKLLSRGRFGPDKKTGPALSPAQLHARYDHVLETAIRLVRQMPDDKLEDQLPDRPRSYRRLMHHIFQIPTAYLDLEDNGGTLTYESLVVPPP